MSRRDSEGNSVSLYYSLLICRPRPQPLNLSRATKFKLSRACVSKLAHLSLTKKVCLAVIVCQ